MAKGKNLNPADAYREQNTSSLVTLPLIQPTRIREVSSQEGTQEGELMSFTGLNLLTQDLVVEQGRQIKGSRIRACQKGHSRYGRTLLLCRNAHPLALQSSRGISRN